MKFGDVQAHLHLLAVDPRHRRKGIGRAMLGWLEKSCDTAAMHEIRLELRASNRIAREFYRHLGYVGKGVIPDYYDRREAALVFGKRLIS